MSNGIAHNNLNDISKIYLDTISDINKKEQSDDVKRWQNEAVKGEDTQRRKDDAADRRKGKGKLFSKKIGDSYAKWTMAKHPKEVDEGKLTSVKATTYGMPSKERQVLIDKERERQGVKPKTTKEEFSNWRTSLREVTSDAEAAAVDAQPEIKEKKVKNKIKINPSFLEAVKEMGGQLLEVKEVDDVEDDKDEKASQKEKKLKLRLLRTKMLAVKQGADDSITAGYEPDIEGAVEYFFEEGINEEGLEQLIEDIGLDDFVDFIEGGTVELNEERAARKASVRAPSYEKVKASVDKSDAAKKAAKKGEYAPSYAKKETEKTKSSKKTQIGRAHV